MIMAKLFYIMGPSGSGKDSLLAYARDHLTSEVPLVFAHRYITRPANAGGENHIALSDQEFTHRLKQGLFAMHWQSHGLRYGIGIEINNWLNQKINVVVNGSREYLPEATKLYPKIKPVIIAVEPAKLKARLDKRGRESRTEIEKRLQKTTLYTDLDHPALHIISNNNKISQAGESLLNLLAGRP